MGESALYGLTLRIALYSAPYSSQRGAQRSGLTSCFVIELTAEFFSHVMQSLCKLPFLSLERLKLSGEIPQSFFLLRNVFLLSVGELVELKN